jgi:ribonuclease HI
MPELATPESLLVGMPTFQRRWDPETFTYTDGSKQEGNPILGAAVVDLTTQTTTYIDATGFDENNTINRAEMVAIHQALLLHTNTPSLRILTDSLCSLQKISALASTPRTRMRDPHLELLCHILALIKQRDSTGKLTHLRKVAAHAGIPGNEAADAAAKAVRSGTVPAGTTIITHRIGAHPHRLPYWVYFQPPQPADAPPGAPPPPLRALTHMKQTRKHTFPTLGTATARPSLYRSLFQFGMLHHGLLLSLPSAGIQSRASSGRHSQARTLIKYLWGQQYNGKLAFRYGHADNDLCPLCGFPDSCTHMGSGCPEMKGSYIKRHNDIVRLLAGLFTTSPIGASAIHTNPVLLYMDAGSMESPLPPDFEVTVEAHRALHDQWKAFLPNDGLNTHTNTRLEDVSIDMQAVRAAIDRQFANTPDAVDRRGRCLPEFILPPAIAQALHARGCGTCPDLIFADGFPDLPVPAHLLDAARLKANLFLIEVGAAADLRLPEKREQKQTYYQPLLDALSEFWGTVTLIIVPVGNAGSMLQVTLDELAAAIAANPAAPDKKAAQAIASSISTLAATSLLGILHLRTTLIAELPEAVRAQHTPSAPQHRTHNRQRQATGPAVHTARVPSHTPAPRAPNTAPPSRPRKPPRDRP